MENKAKGIGRWVTKDNLIWEGMYLMINSTVMEEWYGQMERITLEIM